MSCLQICSKIDGFVLNFAHFQNVMFKSDGFVLNFAQASPPPTVAVEIYSAGWKYVKGIQCFRGRSEADTVERTRSQGWPELFRRVGAPITFFLDCLGFHDPAPITGHLGVRYYVRTYVPT